MSEDYTYIKPDDQRFIEGLLKLLATRREVELFRILQGCRCSICPSNRFSGKRWNAKRTEVIFYLPTDRFEIVREDLKHRLIELCDTIMPKQAGFDVMSVQFSPDIVTGEDVRDLKDHLDSVAKDIGEILGPDILPYDLMIKGREMAEAYIYLYVVENFLRLFIARALKNKVDADRKGLISLNDYAMHFFKNNLSNSLKAGKFIKSFEPFGLTIEIFEHFNIGFAEENWQDLADAISRDNLSLSDAFKAGLIIRRKTEGYYDRFRGRIMFPLLDASFQAVGFIGRLIDDSLPIYLLTPKTLAFDKNRVFFGIEEALEQCKMTSAAIVVEHPLDVLFLHQNGIYNSVALPSSSELSKAHIRILKRYVKRVIFVRDTQSSETPKVPESDLDIAVFVLPHGMSIREYLSKKGAREFLSEAEKSLNTGAHEKSAGDDKERKLLNHVSFDSADNEEYDILKQLSVPTSVQKGISIRRDQESKNRWLSVRAGSELFYLDFKDLGTLILNNWDLFRSSFPDQSWVSSKIDELANCRNLVAHNSLIGSHERDVIRVNFAGIVKQLSRYV